MFPENLVFYLEQYPNTLNWKLWACLDENERWCIQTWKSKPTYSTIKETEELIVKGIEIYARSIKLPLFNLKIEHWK